MTHAYASFLAAIAVRTAVVLLYLVAGLAFDPCQGEYRPVMLWIDLNGLLVLIPRFIDPIERAIVLLENIVHCRLIVLGNCCSGNQDRMFVNLDRIGTGGGRLPADSLAGHKRCDN